MFPTVKDVAKRAGVSPSTVSRVIADHPRISEATKQRVRAAMRELQYYPNAIARSLVRQRSQTIGVALSRSAEAALSNPFFPEVLRGIGSVAQQERYTITLSTATSPEDEYAQCMELLRQRRVDGLILLTARSEDRLVQSLLEEGYPFVVIGRVPHEDVVCVNNDNIAAAYQATMHLVELGHRCIAFIGGPPELIVSQDRLDGYRKALEESGIPYDADLVQVTDFSYEMGRAAASSLIARRPDITAILAVDDMLALGGLAAAREAGMEVPRQLSVIGFNDTPVCPHVAPPLTSVSIPIFDLGVRAAEQLCALLDGESPRKRAVLLPASLVRRASTAPPQHATRRSKEQGKGGDVHS